MKFSFRLKNFKRERREEMIEYYGFNSPFIEIRRICFFKGQKLCFTCT